MGRKKKEKKQNVDVELNLSSEEILEFIEFLDYCREGKETWSRSAGKVHAQLKELVLARLEQRKPRTVLAENVVMPIDNQRLEKLAFSTRTTDTVQIKLDAGLYSEQGRDVSSSVKIDENGGTNGSVIVDDAARAGLFMKDDEEETN